MKIACPHSGNCPLPGIARKFALARKLYEKRKTPVKEICRDLTGVVADMAVVLTGDWAV